MGLDYVLLSVVMAIVAVMLVRGLRRRELMLRFPFLAAATVGGWFLPQAIGLAGQPDLPVGGYELTMTMVALSLIAIIWGDRHFGRQRQPTLTNYNETRLLVVAAGLSAVGAVASMLTHSVSGAEVEAMGGQATGIITIYYFFAKAQYIGFVIALLLLLKRFSWQALALTAFNLNMVLAFILFGGRRGPAVEVATMFLTALWFQRRYAVPRMFMLGAAVAGMLMINVAGEYRRLVTQRNAALVAGESASLPSLEEVLSIDFLGTLTSFATEGSYEARNAIFYIGATNEDLNFDFGLSYWNYLVFRYVPAQFVGRDWKDFLTAEITDSTVTLYGYNRHVGTTFTGFADAFMAFWLFGCLVFAGISALMYRWYSAAMAGSFEAKLFYACTLSVAMHGITHGTVWFVVYLPQLFLFTLPLLAWAKVKTNPLSARPMRMRSPNIRVHRNRA